MKIIYVFLFALFSFCVCAKENDTLADAQQTVTPVPDDLKDLVWNKWDTENFIILSIDKNQGLFLRDNIEDIKTRLITRWGYPDVNFQGQTKIVCVSNKNLLKRIFKLDNPRCEVKKDDKGQIESCSLWFSLEDISKDMAADELMAICIDQVENHYNKKFPLFCKRGMSFLSKNLDQIKNDILKSSMKEISVKEILNTKDHNNEFDTRSAVLCLLLRKEFGQNNYVNYMLTKDLKFFGLQENEKFDEIANRYYRNFIEDLKNNKVPDHYLKINGR
jgi:hypothetical protein